MYLKSIEVHGFKSFANKINFKFHNGITGIVGPNGSGKSNVADAVRWVLGEQRVKQLRGASMQDVIFSGTETRKPLSYAYVAITLDNSEHQLAIDYEEVTIARRIYRSGESEYLMNGTPCRLKDVNELFYDTGIGKEGYSIIGQGQIDKILSGKPEERRELFDEAAGIVKFKRRKYASIKKLEEEKQNLLRVKDILVEQERQIGPLEKQAEIAKVYLKYKEELKKYDVNMFLLEHNRIINQKEETDCKYKIATTDLEEAQKKYQNIKQEYEKIQLDIEALEEEIELLRTNVSDTSVLRGQLQGEINVLKEQINSAKSNAEHLLHRQTSVQAEIKEKEEEKNKIFEEKNEIDTKVSEFTAKWQEQKESLEQIQLQIEQWNIAIETGKNTIIGELNQRATIKSKLSRFDSLIEQTQIRKAELNSKLLQVKSQEVTWESQCKEFEDDFERITIEIAALHKQIEEGETNLIEIRQQLMKEDSFLREQQELYHKEKSKLETITNLVERYEGYGGSVKKVMEKKEEESGIIGVIADIIKVDKKYETAIEIALGGNIQNIVTDNEKTAKSVIQYLKQNKFGRATFLPLTSIEKPQAFKTPEVLKEKGVVGLANELVQIEDAYLNVAKAMLGRIVVVETLEQAIQIAKKYNYGVRMVTLDGELLVPGGAISGGAFKNSSNMLSRRREVDELEKNCKQLLVKIKEIEESIEETKKQRNKIRVDIETKKGEAQRKFIEQNTARINIEQVKEKRKENEVGVGSLQLEENSLEQKLVQIEEEKRISMLELSNSVEMEQKVDLEITQFQSQLEELRQVESEQSKIATSAQLEVEKMLQSQGFQQQNVSRIEGELGGFYKELQEIEEGIANNKEEQIRKETNIGEIITTIEASMTSQSEAEVHLKEAQSKKVTLSEQQKTFFTTREEISVMMNGLDKEVYRLKSLIEKLDEAEEVQINYMWDEYEITLSDASGIRDENMNNLTEMKKEVASLKDNIKKLGDVNVNSIEDFKTLMERYSFLKTQHDDLVEAEQTLLQIIEELDSSMRKQFNEKFAQIKNEFDKVFKELFGGGKGTLELIEEDDILEAGIRIIAQPPGKKLQNMMQLSGGEKALTAIALLFAIQNLKPSPFCLLDEIEAALDESNVGRFAKYLHKLAKNTQFIVVTHRRGTMDQCDRLYGITMQEKGVSTLVSVNLMEEKR